MPSRFAHLTNLPALSSAYIREGLIDDFQYVTNPYVYVRPAKFFTACAFYKQLEQKFGRIMCRYLKNPPYSLYDWHSDEMRNCAINWIIKTNPEARTFHRRNNHDKRFWDVEEITYRTDCPTLIDTSVEHCVFNNWHEDRIILSLSFLEKHTYDTVLEYLSAQTVDRY